MIITANSLSFAQADSPVAAVGSETGRPTHFPIFIQVLPALPPTQA